MRRVRSRCPAEKTGRIVEPRHLFVPVDHVVDRNAGARRQFGTAPAVVTQFPDAAAGNDPEPFVGIGNHAADVLHRAERRIEHRIRLDAVRIFVVTEKPVVAHERHAAAHAQQMEFVGQSVARTASVERPLLDAPAVVAHAAAVDPFRRMFEPEVAHIIRLNAVDRFVQSVDLVHRTVVVEQPQLVIGGVVGAALFAQFHPPQPVTAHVGTAYQRKIGTEFGDARVVAHVEPPVEQVERPRLTAQAGHGAEIGGIDARRQTALVDGEDPLVGSQQQLPLPAAGVVERTGRPLVVGMVIHPFAEQQQRKSPVERRPDILLRILRERHHTVVEQPVFGRKNREQPSVGTGLVQSSEKRPEEIGAARGSDAAVEFVAPQPLRQRRTPRREPFAVVAPQSVGTRPHDPFALVRPGQQHPHGRRREAFAVGQPLEGLLPHPIERAAHLLHPELVARTQKKEHVHLARQAADALVIIKVDAVERLKQHPLRPWM